MFISYKVIYIVKYTSYASLRISIESAALMNGIQTLMNYKGALTIWLILKPKVIGMYVENIWRLILSRFTSVRCRLNVASDLYWVEVPIAAACAEELWISSCDNGQSIYSKLRSTITLSHTLSTSFDCSGYIVAMSAWIHVCASYVDGFLIYKISTFILFFLLIN